MGAVAGYLYWDLYACENGCAITSIWWRTTLFGLFYGGLIADSIRLWQVKVIEKKLTDIKQNE